MTQTPKKRTKKAQLIQILQRKTGADVDTIRTKLGWQAHTIRAAVSGLRKIGFDVIRDDATDKRPARYRIMAEPTPAKARRLEEKATTDAR